MTVTGLPSTLPPKSSTAICAAVTEPWPVGVDAGPFMSVSTPILTTSSDTCASAGDDNSSAASAPYAKPVLTGIWSPPDDVRCIGCSCRQAWPRSGSVIRIFIGRRQLTPAQPMVACRHAATGCRFSALFSKQPGMVTTPHLAAALTPLDAALAMLLDRVAPVAAVELPLREAAGCIAADMPPLKPLPAFDLAAVDGWAFRSSDLVGASSWSPQTLKESPVWVEAGDRMPAGCDCVVDGAAVEQTGPFFQILAEAIPGQGGLPAGGDIAEATSFAAGRRIRPLDLLVARSAGLDRLAVRRPRLR